MCRCLWPRRLSARNGETACLHTDLAVPKRSEAQQKARSGGKPHRQDLHVNASSLRSFDFRQGRSVSCIPQALFPFSLDVVLSLGLCGRAQDIIYCLFSKANVQTWHISFAEHIIIKIWFPPTSFFFFLFHTVRRNAIWGISDSVNFLPIIYIKYRRTGNLCVRRGDWRSQCYERGKHSDKRVRHINGYQCIPSRKMCITSQMMKHQVWESSDPPRPA